MSLGETKLCNEDEACGRLCEIKGILISTSSNFDYIFEYVYVIEFCILLRKI